MYLIKQYILILPRSEISFYRKISSVTNKLCQVAKERSPIAIFIFEIILQRCLGVIKQVEFH